MRKLPKSFWYEDEKLILEEHAYSRLFTKGQEVVINSQLYEVNRTNLCTNGDQIIFVDKTKPRHSER